MGKNRESKEYIIKWLKDDVRPMLIKSNHEILKKQYIEKYKERHNGNTPKKNLISDFEDLIIESKTASIQADDLINEMIKKINSIDKNKSFKIIIVNTIVFLTTLNVIVSFILGYLRSVGVNIIADYNIYSVQNFISAIIGFVILIFNYIYSLYKSP